MGRLISLAAQQYSAAGDPKKAFELYQRQLREISNQRRGRGYQFSANRAIAAILIQMGDIAQAEAYIRRNQPLLQEARTSGHPGNAGRLTIPTARTGKRKSSIGRAMLFEARGQFRDAEAAFKLGELRKRAAIKPMLSGAENPPSESSLLIAVDFAVLEPGPDEGAAGAFCRGRGRCPSRAAVAVEESGQVQRRHPRFIAGLADILVEQGRYAEAEQLARVALEISPDCRRCRGFSHRTCSNCRSSAAS